MSIAGRHPVQVRAWRGGRHLWSVLSIVVVAAVFGFLLPQLASYRGVWAQMSSMPWRTAMLVAAVAVGHLITSWIMIVAMAPSLRLREAVVVHLGSTAVANTLPAGGAVSVAVSWAMLSSWGISAAENMVYTLVSGLWNTAAKFGLPILALAILAVTGDTNTGLIAAAVAGLALLVLGATGSFLVLHRDSGRATQAVEGMLALAFRLRRRPAPQHPGPALAEFRDRTLALLAARGGRIALVTAMVHLSLALVLFTCLHASGVTQAQVPWQITLAAFAFARLLSALPITPGGLGVVELGLTGVLSAGQDGPTTAKIAAAVLLFRAVTYLLPIPLGAAAYLTWQTNTTWRMNNQTRTALNHKPIEARGATAHQPTTDDRHDPGKAAATTGSADTAKSAAAPGLRMQCRIHQ